jgi:lysophospholipase L1-like esterase
MSIGYPPLFRALALSRFRDSTSAAIALACWLCLETGATHADDEAPFAFRDQDRVVLLGGTFIERMQDDGYLEAMLTLGHPRQQLTFRNLGWSGDTVWGESRALFGESADGFARLVKDAREAQPTVLLICYGANEANAGAAGLPRFVDGLNHLLDALAETRARLLLLSPPPRVRPSPRLPDPQPYNATLRQYATAIADVARRRSAAFIDLGEVSERHKIGADAYGSDGVQLTPDGNYQFAQAICQALKIDVRLPADRAAELRRVIQQKNTLYFHRYRPQNETYLFLFRKREQGNNAVEIPQFDPLIVEKEREIAALRAKRSAS